MENIQKIIRRLECESTQYHLVRSAYSQAELNLLYLAQDNPTIENGWLLIGDVELEFLKIKKFPIKSDRVPVIKWIRLKSWDDPCLEYHAK